MQTEKRPQPGFKPGTFLLGSNIALYHTAHYQALYLNFFSEDCYISHIESLCLYLKLKHRNWHLVVALYFRGHQTGYWQ